MNTKEYEELLSDVETRLDRLRALYEQYFQGIERLEPTVPKKEVERRMQLLRRSQPRNTALRFRTQQVIQKYTTYLTYWTRVARQIEEGTFRRDVLRARQRRDEARQARRAERESPPPAALELDIDVDAVGELDAAVEGAQKPAPSVSPIAPPSVRPRTPVTTEGKSIRPALSPFGLPKGRASEQPQRPAPSATFGKPRDPVAAGGSARGEPPPSSINIRDVYAKYVEARRRNNERTDNVRYESIEKSINDMLPRLREKYRGKRIDFEVVVKDGKVGLKPVAK